MQGRIPYPYLQFKEIPDVTFHARGTSTTSLFLDRLIRKDSYMLPSVRRYGVSLIPASRFLVAYLNPQRSRVLLLAVLLLASTGLELANPITLGGLQRQQMLNTLINRLC